MFFDRRISARTRAWIEMLGTGLLLMPFCLFLIWISWHYVVVSWSVAEGSREAGGLGGVYLVKALIPVMAATVLLQGLARALRAGALLAAANKARWLTLCLC